MKSTHYLGLERMSRAHVVEPGIRPLVGARRWLAPLVVFTAIALARLVYVSLFAVDTPQWDQWDSEAALLLKPWVEGTWTPLQLLSLHNEHRVAFTRLLILTLFELNGRQWDNLVEAYATALLAAAALTLVFSSLRRDSCSGTAWIAGISTVALGVMPFPWENMLVGFQSTFYFLLLGSVALTSLAAFRRPSPSTTAILCIVALLSLVTAASGMLASCAAFFVIAARSWHSRSVSRFDIASMAAMLFVALLGFLILPILPGSETLYPVGLTGHLDALATGLSWPLETLPDRPASFIKRALFALIFWLPSAIALWRVSRRQCISGSMWFALGMSALTFAQLVALAHSRGHDTLHLASRYMDIPAVGLIVNGWLAAELLSLARRWKAAHAAHAILLCSCALYALNLRTPWDLGLIRQRAWYTTTETANVAAYMASGDQSWLARPALEIPYPTANRLKSLLDDLTIASLLPPSISHPYVITARMTGFRTDGIPKPWLAPPGATVIGSYSKDKIPASFISDRIYSSRPYVILRQTGPRARRGTNSLWLENATGQTSEFKAISKSRDGAWHRTYARNPGGEVRLHAIDGTTDHWVAIAEIVDAGILSTAAARLQDAVRRALPHAYVTPAMPEGDPAAATVASEALVSGGLCSIDLVNGVPPSNDVMIPPSSLSIDGWALVPQNSVPESQSVIVSLVSESGERISKEAVKTLRPDVNDTFHQPLMAYLGFEVRIDASALVGKYRVEIVQRNTDERKVCPRPDLTIRISNKS